MIEITKVIFETKEIFKQKDIKKFRGFLGNKFKSDVTFHNHLDNSKLNYQMPLIQYKIIDSKLSIIGINEGGEILRKNILTVTSLKIGERNINDFEIKVKVKKEKLIVDDELHTYSFSSPWLPLNQNNINKYYENKSNLNHILQNHILTNFKGLNIEADKQIIVKGFFKETSVIYKNQKLIGFTGDFMTNVLLPENLGLGKARALGFGNVINKK